MMHAKNQQGVLRLNKTLVAFAAAGFGLVPLAQAADADRMAQMEQQLKLLQEELKNLKKSGSGNTSKEVSELREEVAAQKKEAVVAGSIPGSFRLPGSDLSIRPYAVAELNMVHESKGDNGANDYSTFAPMMPLNGSVEAQRKGQTFLHARTSRLGVEGVTPTAYGPAKFKVEGDFNNDPRTGNSALSGSWQNVMTQLSTNSYEFRLRHAYLQVGPWLAGQTWSTFMDGANAPETVDFNGPIGSTFIRQPQIRYTHATQNYGDFSAAIENSASYVLDPHGYPTADGFSKVPDLVVRWDKSFAWGGLSLRGVSHELRVNGPLGNTSRRGSGFGVSGSVYASANDTFNWLVTGGNGIGRYLTVIQGAAYDASNNHIEMERAMGVVLGYQHRFSETMRMNLVYSTQKNFNNAYDDLARTNGFAGGQYGVNRRVSQYHIGGIWNPLKFVDVGLEYIYGKRETLLGETGELSRLNFMVRYNLN